MITGRKSGQNLQQKRDNLGENLLARIFHRWLLFLPARFGSALLFGPRTTIAAAFEELWPCFRPQPLGNLLGKKLLWPHCEHFKDKWVKTRFDWGNTLAKVQKISCQTNCLITPSCDQTIQICCHSVKMLLLLLPADIKLSPTLSLTSFSKSTTT